MIIKEGTMISADHTGALSIRCIGILGCTKNRWATLGNVLKVVVHRYLEKPRKPHHDDREYSKLQLNLKSTYFAWVISVAKNYRRDGNFFFKSRRNRAVLLNRKRELHAGLEGLVMRELLISSNVNDSCKEAFDPEDIL